MTLPLPTLAGVLVAGLLFAGAAAAADFTASEPTSDAIRDALAGSGGEDGVKSFGGGAERRASLAVEFAVNSATLTPRAHRTVDILAAAIMDPALNGVRVVIEGHTDASGAFDQNMRLSAQRAASVVSALLQRGVPSWRLTGVGRGPTDPLPGLSPYDPRNRRVDAAVAP